MKLDLHVHTHYSGNTTIYPLSKIMKVEERFNRALLVDLVKRPAIRAPEVA